MQAVDVDSLTLTGAFLLGALVATVAMLRLLRSVTMFFAGLERRHRRHEEDQDDDE